MPAKYRTNSMKGGPLPKGVSNRNAGIRWILKHGDPAGVLYFADDDNTYDAKLFSEAHTYQSVLHFVWTY